MQLRFKNLTKEEKKEILVTIMHSLDECDLHYSDEEKFDAFEIVRDCYLNEYGGEE